MNLLFSLSIYPQDHYYTVSLYCSHSISHLQNPETATKPKPSHCIFDDIPSTSASSIRNPINTASLWNELDLLNQFLFVILQKHTGKLSWVALANLSQAMLDLTPSQLESLVWKHKQVCLVFVHISYCSWTWTLTLLTPNIALSTFSSKHSLKLSLECTWKALLKTDAKLIIRSNS